MLMDMHGLPIVSRKRLIKITNPQIAKFAAFADDVFKQLELTVVCVHCGGTPQMNNAVTDTNWRMTCACSERILRNPEVQ